VELVIRLRNPIPSQADADEYLRQWRRGLQPGPQATPRFKIRVAPDDTIAQNQILADRRTLDLIERAQIYAPGHGPGVDVRESRAGQQMRASSRRVKETSGFLPGSFANDADWDKEELVRLKRDWLQPSQPRPGIRGIEFPEDSVPRIPVLFSRPQLTTAPETGVQPVSGEPAARLPSRRNWRQDPSDIASIGTTGPSTTTLNRGGRVPYGPPQIDMGRMVRLVRTNVFGDTGSAEVTTV